MPTCSEHFKPTLQRILRTILNLDAGLWLARLRVARHGYKLQGDPRVVLSWCSFPPRKSTNNFVERHQRPSKCQNESIYVYMYVSVTRVQSISHVQCGLLNLKKNILTTNFRIFFTKNQPFNRNLSTSKRHSLGIWMCQHGRMHQTFVVDKFVQLRWLGGGSKIHQMQMVEMV